MAGRLVVLDRSGRARSKSFALGSGMCTLGRGAACDIRVLLPEVSPHHATVTVHANQTVVRNVGSGATLVNGAPVSVCALQHCDELDICGRKLRWEYDTPQAPKRNKTQPALALPAAPPRAARRGTLGAPPRAPDRDVQLALELRHRASMPGGSGAGGKQVAIVQPQRRNTENQNESACARVESPLEAPAPRKAAGARLHTPTKATLWIESRRGATGGRARAASLRTTTPLRLTVLRKALTPAPTRVRVTKIQAPLHIDHTKRAAIMLMTGHTPKSKQPSPKTPTFVVKKRSPVTRTSKGRSTLNASGKATRSSPQIVISETPNKSTRKSNARNSRKQSVSVLEITDSSHSAALGLPNPPKSALKSGRARKTDSIKFDLSNLEPRSDEDMVLLASTTRDTEDVTLRYSSSPAPSPRRSIHSRSGRMLESLGSPLRSPATRTSAPASPASPRSLKSARGSSIVQKALESSDTFVTEYSNKTSRRSNLEAYSVVDLVSLDSDTSRSVYGSAGSPSFGSSTPYAKRVPMDLDDTLTTPENVPRVPSQSTRKSRSNRSRSRLDDSTRTIDSIEDDSPKSSRKLVKSALKRSRSLNDFPESPQTYISLDSSPKSLGNISTTTKRGSRSQLNASDLLVSPKKISIESMKKSLSRVLSASKRSPRNQDNTLDSAKDISSTRSKTPAKRGSRGDATITLSFPLSASRSRSRVDESYFESPDISANSTRKSLGKTLSAAKRGSRRQFENTTLGSPNVSTKRKSPLTKRSSRSLDNSTLRSPDLSVNSTRKSAGKTPSPTKRGSRSQLNISVPSGSPKTNVLANSARMSPKKSPSPTKRSSRSQLDTSSLESPKANVSARTTGKTPSPKRSSNTASPKSPILVNSSKKSLGKTLSPTKRSSRSQVDILISPNDLTDTTRKSTGKTSASNRGSRSKMIDSLLSPQLDALANSTRRSLGKTLSVSKRGSRSLAETILSSPETTALADSTRKSLGKTPKRGSRSQAESILSSPEFTALADSTRKSLGKTPKRGSRSQAESILSSPETTTLADSTRKSLGKTPKRGSRSQAESILSSPETTTLADSTRKSLGKTPKRGSRSQAESILSSPEANASTNSNRKSLAASKRGTRSKIIDSVLSPQLDALTDATRKSLGKSLSSTKRGSRGSSKLDASANSTRKSTVLTLSDSKRASRQADSPFSSPKALADSTRKSLSKTPKRGSRSQLDNITLESPKESPRKSLKANVTNSSIRKSVATLSATNRSSRSKIIDSVLSPQLDALSDAKRKSVSLRVSKNLSTTQGSRSLVDSVSPKDASTRKSAGKSPSKRVSQLNDSVPESPKANVTNSSIRKSVATLSATNRSSRSKIIDSVLSPQLDALSDSKRKSISKNLSTKQGSRSLLDSISPKDASTRKSAGKSTSKRASQLNDSEPESPKDATRKSRTHNLSTSSRRTRSLPLSPRASTSAKRSRISAVLTPKQSPVVSPRQNAARKSAKSPSNTPLAHPKSASPRKSPKSSAKSPKISPKSKSRISRKSLTVSITSPRNKTVADGEVTPEERGSLEDAGTPILSIRSLLDATMTDSPGEPPSKRGRPSAIEKRKTFAAQNAPRNARGSIRSKSLILVRDTGDLTPTGVAELTPEAVKSKHSSAKKSRSRRSIIDNLEDSGLVKHLFNSPVKRKLSQSMSEFSRRLEETEELSPNVSGVKRLLTKKSPRNELKDFNGVRRLMRTPRARRSIKNDLTDVAGVKVMFAAAPRDSFGDVRGIKRAFQGSPKNDLGQVSGVKSLFNKNKPRDDLSDVRGVRELFKRGPRNELDASGVKDGLQVKSPKNDLRDVRGVRKLFRQSKAQTSLNLSGVAMLLDESEPAEASFRLGGKPSARATYSKTFVARSAQKPAKRRRASSLSGPGEVLVDNVEELEKRTKSVNRELQKLSTATVSGATPLLGSRRSAAESYAAHTLPIKKRSLERAQEPRPATASLPLKKRALAHSTPVRGRGGGRGSGRGRPDADLARVSPIPVAPPAPPATGRQPRGSPAVRNSPKQPKLSKAPELEKVEKNESVLPSPKKTRAKQAQEVDRTQRATRRGIKASPKKKPTPKKPVVAKKVPVTVEEPTEEDPVPEAPIAKPATPKKATRAKKIVTPKKVTPRKTTRGKKAPTPSPKKSPTPKKTTRVKKVVTPTKAATPKKSTPKKATRAKKVLTPTASPKKSPTPKKATRSKKVIPAKAATPKQTAVNPTVVVKKLRVVVAASPKPTRGANKAANSPPKSPAIKQSKSKRTAVTKSPPKSPAIKQPRSKRTAVTKSPPKSPVTKPSRSKKTAVTKSPPKAPVTKSRAKKVQSPAPVVEKRGPKAKRVSLVLSKPLPVLKPQPAARAKRSARNDPKESPKKVEQKNLAAGDAPITSKAVTPQKGRRGKASPKKAPPQKTTPEPRRGRGAASSKNNETVETKPTKAAKGKTEVVATPEPRRGRKAPATSEAKTGAKTTPQPKKGRKATASPKAHEPKNKVAKEPESKRGRKTAVKEQVQEPATRRGRRPVAEAEDSPPPRAANTQAAKPKGKKVTIVEPVQSPPRGRKRKNDSVDKKTEPSPKKTRVSRSAQAAAPARRRR